VLITIGINSILSPLGQVISASGKMWQAFLMNLAWALVYVCGALMLVPFGASGVAIARAVAYSAHFVWTLLFARWLLASFRVNEISDVES